MKLVELLRIYSCGNENVDVSRKIPSRQAREAYDLSNDIEVIYLSLLYSLRFLFCNFKQKERKNRDNSVEN